MALANCIMLNFWNTKLLHQSLKSKYWFWLEESRSLVISKTTNLINLTNPCLRFSNICQAKKKRHLRSIPFGGGSIFGQFIAIWSHIRNCTRIETLISSFIFGVFRAKFGLTWWCICQIWTSNVNFLVAVISERFS